MPELPEVQTVVTSLRGRILSAKIVQVRLNRTDIVSPQGTDLPHLLAQRVVVAIDRRAKRIVLGLDDGNSFYIHLGMSGQLTVEEAEAEVRKHTHLVLELEGSGLGVQGSGRMQLRFRDPRRFGGVFWMGRDAADESLGPEPLTLRPSRLSKLVAKTRRPIKSALLDQSMIAGLGNIYADEALFLAGIHPLTPANTLSREHIVRLNRAIKSTLRRAIAARGSTLRDYVDADNSPGEYRLQHKVYGREGEKCRRCESTIRRIVLAGRSTCFCPRCQPSVRRRDRH